jgi:hypothetical protein
LSEKSFLFVEGDGSDLSAVSEGRRHKHSSVGGTVVIEKDRSCKPSSERVSLHINFNNLGSIREDRRIHRC